MDSSFLESRLQPDSFFGAGGQRGRPKRFRHWRLLDGLAQPARCRGRVDPVAEADVYLAYGRDLQAEEILKGSRAPQPGTGIRARQVGRVRQAPDRKALEAVATEIHSLTGAKALTGTALPNWVATSMTIPVPAGGRPAGAPAVSLSAPDSILPPDLDPRPRPGSRPADDALSDAPAAAGSFAAAAASEASPAPPKAPLSSLIDGQPALPRNRLGRLPLHPHRPRHQRSAPPSQLDMPMDLPPLDTQPDALETPAPAYTPSGSGLMEFDLDSISLDLDTPTPPDRPVPDEGSLRRPPACPDDPLATKLAPWLRSSRPPWRQRWRPHIDHRAFAARPVPQAVRRRCCSELS